MRCMRSPDFSRGVITALGWRLHPLHGELEGHWSVDVSGNWRLTFGFEGEDAVCGLSRLPLRFYDAYAQSAPSRGSASRLSWRRVDNRRREAFGG